MESQQVKLLVALSKRLRKEKKEESAIIFSLKEAGILGNNGKISNNYPTLKKMMGTIVAK
jgi:hypothetical protein